VRGFSNVLAYFVRIATGTANKEVRPMNFGFMRVHPDLRVFVVTVVTTCLLWSASIPAALAAQEENQPQQSQVRTVPSEGPSLSELEKEPGWSYNSDYVFAISRALRDSTIPPAGKVPLFILTIPLDTVFLPFSLLAGLMGD